MTDRITKPPIKDPSQDGFPVSSGATLRKGSFFGYNDMNGGWIKLHRSIIDHWIFEDAIKLKWWIYLLAVVNHEPKKVLIKNTLVDCDRGQTVRSLESLALKWLVTKKTVKTFLDLLQRDNMIVLENIKISTRITICNYDSYQDTVNATDTPSKRDLPINKNEKNDKNEKNKGFDFSNFSESEVVILKKWLDYKHVRKESYKTQESFELMAKKLFDLSRGDESKALKIIEQSMANNWAGLFELKNTGVLKSEHVPVPKSHQPWKSKLVYPENFGK